MGRLLQNQGSCVMKATGACHWRLLLKAGAMRHVAQSRPVVHCRHLTGATQLACTFSMAQVIQNIVPLQQPMNQPMPYSSALVP